MASSRYPWADGKDRRCEVCRRRAGLPCCQLHHVIVCMRCYDIITERFILPSLEQRLVPDTASHVA